MQQEHDIRDFKRQRVVKDKIEYLTGYQRELRKKLTDTQGVT
jgi:hypothetical protein